MKKQNYIKLLKRMNIQPRVVKTEQKGTILTEDFVKKLRVIQRRILKEIFIRSGEIEEMPRGQLRDMQILRLGIIAEMDASNLYEKLALLAKDKRVADVMRDVSREEKVHVGEFKALLEEIDPEFEAAEDEGESEVESKT